MDEETIIQRRNKETFLKLDSDACVNAGSRAIKKTNYSVRSMADAIDTHIQFNAV